MSRYNPNIILYDETGKITFDSQKLQAERDELVAFVTQVAESGWTHDGYMESYFNPKAKAKQLLSRIKEADKARETSLTTKDE